MGGLTEVTKVTLTAAMASFRNPLYAAAAATYPVPPPSTVKGIIAAASNDLELASSCQFAYTFTSQGTGTDLETSHAAWINNSNAGYTLSASADKGVSAKERDFLCFPTLNIYLTRNMEKFFKQPTWPLTIGRSQDVALVEMKNISLQPGKGVQGNAIVPANRGTGRLLRMPYQRSVNKHHTTWNNYRYHPGSTFVIDSEYNDQGQAIVWL